MSNEVLEYIGLDISKSNKNLKSVKPEYNITKSYDNYLLYKVYKIIPVKDIEILISNTDRTTEIKERYLTAKPLDIYIKENEEDFLNLAKQAKIKEIEEIEKNQEDLVKNMPYFIRYDKNYLWQIYYSKTDKKYFMLFPAKEGETSVLFYLIKKKLEKSKDKIYVPICKEDYSDNLMKPNEITDIENYIWLFTKEWPKIYEVEDRMYIIGTTRLKEGFESKYRIEIDSKEDGDSEYTLFKALFILSTETNYKFSPCIDDSGKLRLEYDDEILQIDNLTDFIERQAFVQKNKTTELEKDIKENNNLLESLKKEIEELSEKYRLQEKQIVMFLNCKNSFFKKLKYYFKKSDKGTRFNTKTKDIENLNKTEKKKIIDENSAEDKQEEVAEKSINVFNLSDLVKLCQSNKKQENECKRIKSDLNAMKNKKKNLEKRVKNASEYIDEIEKHKKSIFEFWKFAKKDENPALKEGEESPAPKKLEVAFNIDEDMPEFVIKADNLQKQKLSIDECNSVFACRYVLNSINAVMTGKNEDKVLQEDLEELKSKYKGNKRTEIFGDIEEDYTKIKNLNNKKHRENKKNIYSILRVNDKTTIEDFRNTIENIVRLLNEAYKKITAIADFAIYYTDDKEDEYTIAEINPKDIKIEDLKEKVVYKMQLNKDDNILYFSNITYYDNYNQTLPTGMDEATSVLVKLGKNKNKKETTINIISEKDLYSIKINKIRVVKWYD